MNRVMMIFMVLVCLGIWAAIAVLPDGKLHVIFCDVGQGDATLVTWKQVQILIDGGPDGKVLECMARFIPFFDRKIELVILTHAHADHMTGLIDVFKRYSVSMFVAGEMGGTGKRFDQLIAEIEKSGARKMSKYAGETMEWKNKRGEVLGMDWVWPTKDWMAGKIRGMDNADINRDDRVLGFSNIGDDMNTYSEGEILKYGEFRVLLTGDAGVSIDDEELTAGYLSAVDVLKVPHHGSKTGMSKKWLDEVNPKLAVVSVGAKNSFGHPAIEILNLLAEAGARVLRTDRDGTVEVVSDGSHWWVR